MSSKGRYGLSVLDKNGKIKKEKSIDNTCNVVTYAGAYEALIADGLFGYYFAAIGTGTTELVRASTALNSESSGRSSFANAGRSGNEVDNGDGTVTVTLSRVLPFNLGAKVGTFSEVGLFNSSSAGILIAGQLIKDEFGAPTTITILADEQLVVTYILEWTVPNYSSLIGTGTVTDSASNTYDYEVYSQPYFFLFASNSASVSSRYTKSSFGDEIGFYDADGSTSLYNSGDLGTGFLQPGGVTHNGSGTVTFQTGAEVFSPAEGAWTGLTYLSFYGRDSTQASQTGVSDTVNNLSPSNTLAAYTLLLKFLNPISKTDSQSFEIQASFTVTI